MDWMKLLIYKSIFKIIFKKLLSILRTFLALKGIQEYLFAKQKTDTYYIPSLIFKSFVVYVWQNLPYCSHVHQEKNQKTHPNKYFP